MIISMIISIISTPMLMIQEEKLEVANTEFPTLCQRKTYYQVEIIFISSL